MPTSNTHTQRGESERERVCLSERRQFSEASSDDILA